MRISKYINSNERANKMDDIKKIIGRNLKYFRYESRLCQEKFYGEYKLNPKYMACVERGEINVSIEFLNNLAELLEKDICDFFNTDPAHIIKEKRIDSKKES